MLRMIIILIAGCCGIFAAEPICGFQPIPEDNSVGSKTTLATLRETEDALPPHPWGCLTLLEEQPGDNPDRLVALPWRRICPTLPSVNLIECQKIFLRENVPNKRLPRTNGGRHTVCELLMDGKVYDLYFMYKDGRQHLMFSGSRVKTFMGTADWTYVTRWDQSAFEISSTFYEAGEAVVWVAQIYHTAVLKSNGRFVKKMLNINVSTNSKTADDERAHVTQIPLFRRLEQHCCKNFMNLTSCFVKAFKGYTFDEAMSFRHTKHYQSVCACYVDKQRRSWRFLHQNSSMEVCYKALKEIFSMEIFYDGGTSFSLQDSLCTWHIFAPKKGQGTLSLPGGVEVYNCLGWSVKRGEVASEVCLGEDSQMLDVMIFSSLPMAVDLPWIDRLSKHNDPFLSLFVSGVKVWSIDRVDFCKYQTGFSSPSAFSSVYIFLAGIDAWSDKGMYSFSFAYPREIAGYGLVFRNMSERGKLRFVLQGFNRHWDVCISNGALLPRGEKNAEVLQLQLPVCMRGYSFGKGEHYLGRLGAGWIFPMCDGESLLCLHECSVSRVGQSVQPHHSLRIIHQQIREGREYNRTLMAPRLWEDKCHKLGVKRLGDKGAEHSEGPAFALPKLI